MNTLRERHFFYSIHGFLDYSHVGTGWPLVLHLNTLLLFVLLGRVQLWWQRDVPTGSIAGLFSTLSPTPFFILSLYQLGKIWPQSLLLLNQKEPENQSFSQVGWLLVAPLPSADLTKSRPYIRSWAKARHTSSKRRGFFEEASTHQLFCFYLINMY